MSEKRIAPAIAIACGIIGLASAVLGPVVLIFFGMGGHPGISEQTAMLIVNSLRDPDLGLFAWCLVFVRKLAVSNELRV